MNNIKDFMKKYDRIPSPYSTYLAIIGVGIFGLLFIVIIPDFEQLGIGIIIGGLLSLILKIAAECSDREVLTNVLNYLGLRKDDGKKIMKNETEEQNNENA